MEQQPIIQHTAFDKIHGYTANNESEYLRYLFSGSRLTALRNWREIDKAGLRTWVGSGMYFTANDLAMLRGLVDGYIAKLERTLKLGWDTDNTFISKFAGTLK